MARDGSRGPLPVIQNTVGTVPASASIPLEHHPFHAADREWPESNCYVDLWIEILHAARLEVAPLLPFTLASDFEGDQWTFYKPPLSDLSRLYGLEVEELNIWRDLLTHCVEQVARGRIPMVEMDAFYLPDTHGRGYRAAHSKTTIGIQAIDTQRQSLRYMHNRGVYELEGADYRGIFRLDPPAAPEGLPPYCEIAKLDRIVRRDAADLRNISLELAAMHLARRPQTNPITRYAEAVGDQLSQLISEQPQAFDLYAFATIRQCGSCFGFTADYLRWLAQQDPGWNDGAAAFGRISSLASMLVLKMARIVHSGHLKDLGDTFREMSAAWDRGMQEVERRLQA